MDEDNNGLLINSENFQALNIMLEKYEFIYLAIDDLELFKLNELTELLYSRENFIANVSVVHKPEGRNQEKFFGTSNEYMLVYSKNKSIADFYTVILDDSIKDKFDLFDNSGSY